MSWRSQGPEGMLAVGDPYVAGGTMVIDTVLTTHHNGHMEVRACVMDSAKPQKCSTSSDFEGNELTFLRDLVKEGNHPAMYPDPNFPERGFYAGGQAGTIKYFSHMFRIPEGIYGERVLLQWKYITANAVSFVMLLSCMPSLEDHAILTPSPLLPVHASRLRGLLRPAREPAQRLLGRGPASLHASLSQRRHPLGDLARA
ncbi:hypothetical protein ACHAWF_011642 [Thalassiosira exigua]